jgi:hypothetical protein
MDVGTDPNTILPFECLTLSVGRTDGWIISVPLSSLPMGQVRAYALYIRQVFVHYNLSYFYCIRY